MALDIERYYAERADEYERIYAKPERQQDLARLRRELPALLSDRDVLEVACGTGYWTHLVAARARTVTAIDVNREVLAIAASKPCARNNVAFLKRDVYQAGTLPQAYSGGLAAFW